MKNSRQGQKNLFIGKYNKKDEFYTQLIDIERELKYYKHHFKNKVIFCNCDDPKWSNFWKYFAMNFDLLGIKKVISTHFDHEKSTYKLELIRTNNGTIETIKTDLKTNGDFRSKECIEILKEADIVITNPPFSLFREYVAQLIRYQKKFLIIGNINCITYKTIFNQIEKNQIWLGINYGRGISGFQVPKSYNLYGLETKITQNNQKFVSPNNCLWLTNLSHFKRNEKIILKKIYDPGEYEKYDNYEAINVNFTKNIPRNYYGILGVPITFLTKYNPDQFKIVKFRKGDDGKDLSINGKATYFRILIKQKIKQKNDNDFLRHP